MTSGRRVKVTLSSAPLWRPDARERLRALLPELVVSVVGATFMSVVLVYGDGTDAISFALGSKVLSLIMISGPLQAFVLGSLYAAFYLMLDPDRDENVYATKFVMPCLIVMCAIYATIIPLGGAFPIAVEGSLRLVVTASALAGMALFFISRTRPTFVFFLLEILVLVEAIDEMAAEQPAMLFVHIGCISSVATLFVMRSSATRITIADAVEPLARTDDAKVGWLSALGMYGQVAAAALAASLLCLAVALPGALMMGRGAETGGAEASSSGVSGTEDAPTDMPAQEEPMVEVSGAEGVGEGTQSVGATSAELDRGALLGLLILLLVSILILPVPARLLRRWWRRLSLARERQADVRAAKIYLGILSRLEAAGIVRDQAQTPSEFLIEHAHELEDLTVPAGLTLDDWDALTGIYEKVRYEGLVPTEPELHTCWRIYGALPRCVRLQVGWRHYLTGAFWHM